MERRVTWSGRQSATSPPWWVCWWRWSLMFNQVDGRLDRVHELMDRTQAETNARFDAVLEAIVSFDRRGRRAGMRSRWRIGGRGLRPLRTPHLAAKRGLMMRLTSHQLRGNRPFRGFRWGVLYACAAKRRSASNGAGFRAFQSLHIRAYAKLGATRLFSFPPTLPLHTPGKDSSEVAACPSSIPSGSSVGV